MATTHFERVVYKSGSALATGRITYITGAEARVPAAARIEHQGLAARTRQPREDVLAWRHANLPGWATDDPITFFRAAEKYEGAGRVAYTEWRISLPRELGRERYLEVAEDILDAAFGERNPYVYAVHNPPASDGGDQPHIHVIWSGRVNDGIDRSPATYFRWHNATHPERGGAMKDPWSYHRGAVKASRVLYTDLMNLWLERCGHRARLHPDRLEARGFSRPPEPRLKPSDSNELKLRGRRTDAMADVLRSRVERQSAQRTEQIDAYASWVQRKREIGITPQMTPEAQRQCILAARQARVTQPPKRLTTQEAQQRLADLTAYDATLVRLAAALRIERQIEAHHAAQGSARPYEGTRRFARLLAEVSNPRAPWRVARQTASSRVARATTRLKARLAVYSQALQQGAPVHVHVLTEDERHRLEAMLSGRDH